MKERPILFSAPMVHALLDCTKSQTRRVVKPQPHDPAQEIYAAPLMIHGTGSYTQDHMLADGFDGGTCPYGRPGDRLWVRETWQAFFDDEVPPDRPRGPRHTMGIPAQPERKSFAFYRADGDMPLHPKYGAARWIPSIHMPRKYSRILLEITGVRVERLQDISEADAVAEGIERVDNFFDCPCWKVYGEPDGADVSAPDDPIGSYRSLWESINGPGSWDVNPWVWVIEFKRVME